MTAGKRILYNFEQSPCQVNRWSTALERTPLKYAKILLAMAALREKKTEVARTQLKDLLAESSENTLFTSELAKVKVSPAVDTLSPERILPKQDALQPPVY